MVTQSDFKKAVNDFLTANVIFKPRLVTRLPRDFVHAQENWSHFTTREIWTAVLTHFGTVEMIQSMPSEVFQNQIVPVIESDTSGTVAELVVSAEIYHPSLETWMITHPHLVSAFSVNAKSILAARGEQNLPIIAGLLKGDSFTSTHTALALTDLDATWDPTSQIALAELYTEKVQKVTDPALVSWILNKLKYLSPEFTISYATQVIEEEQSNVEIDNRKVPLLATSMPYVFAAFNATFDENLRQSFALAVLLSSDINVPRDSFSVIWQAAILNSPHNLLSLLAGCNEEKLETALRIIKEAYSKDKSMAELCIQAAQRLLDEAGSYIEIRKLLSVLLNNLELEVYSDFLKQLDKQYPHRDNSWFKPVSWDTMLRDDMWVYDCVHWPAWAKDSILTQYFMSLNKSPQQYLLTPIMRALREVESLLLDPDSNVSWDLLDVLSHVKLAHSEWMTCLLKWVKEPPHLLSVAYVVVGIVRSKSNRQLLESADCEYVSLLNQAIEHGDIELNKEIYSLNIEM